MMTRISYLFCILALQGLIPFAGADSPLTSTPFGLAYHDVPVVREAAGSNGRLTRRMAAFLSDNNQQTDEKLALINQLGWNPGGKNNGKRFLRQLVRSGVVRNETDLLNSGMQDLVICYAYLLAMDNYFAVDRAYEISLGALQAGAGSFSTQLVSALIGAQLAMGEDWCMVYKLPHAVRSNHALELDMRRDAVSIVFEYVDGYKEECK